MTAQCGQTTLATVRKMSLLACCRRMIPTLIVGSWMARTWTTLCNLSLSLTLCALYVRPVDNKPWKASLTVKTVPLEVQS